LTFYPLKKVALPLRRVGKKSFKIFHKGYQKKWNFAPVSKMCRSLEFSQREKNLQKNFSASFVTGTLCAQF
jgi:hypothetical protein